jgi:hypothetical protein
MENSMKSFIKNNPIKLIVLLVIFVLMSALLLTAEPKGYCSGKAFNGKTGVYLTDEEFIFAALKIISWADTPRGVYTEDGGVVVKPTDEVIKNFMKKHPNCCRVYRDLTGSGPNTHHSLLSRALRMKQFVIVAYQDFEGLKNDPIFLGFDDKYLTMDTCGRGYSY